jgi:hypothetical protein
MNTYWNNNGIFQKEYDFLSKLIPDNRTDGTFDLDMIHAVSRIYYDLYNNGGCNNTSGAVNFLIHASQKFDLNLNDELNAIKYAAPFCAYNEDDYEADVESLADKVIKFVFDKLIEFYKQSDSDTIDLFDFADPDQFYDEEE